jgi:hypothetical protein
LGFFFFWFSSSRTAGGIHATVSLKKQVGERWRCGPLRVTSSAAFLVAEALVFIGLQAAGHLDGRWGHSSRRGGRGRDEGEVDLEEEGDGSID